MTLADDFERIIKVLSDAPIEGYTQEEIQKLSRDSVVHLYALWEINDFLTQLVLNGTVGKHKIRNKKTRRSETRYFLKSKGD